MLKRTLTGLALVSVIFICIFWLRMYSPFIADAIIVLFAFMGSYEMFKSLRSGGLKVMSTPLIVNGLISYPLAYFFGAGGIMMALVIGCILAVANLTFRRDNYEIKDLAATLFTEVYPMSIMMLMVVMNHEVGNLLAMVLVFAIVVLTDTMAYFVGVTCKGPKMCPNISPKKTISGAIGGLFGGMIGATLVWLLFDYFNVFSYMGDSFINLISNKWGALGIYLALGLVCSVVAELGDLGASIIKRKIGIKDYGHIFPGHGGVMDRIDSFLFVIPVVFIVISIITKVVA